MPNIITSSTVDAIGEAIALKADASLFGNATASDVAVGKTFTSAAGLKVTATKQASGSSGALKWVLTNAPIYIRMGNIGQKAEITISSLNTVQYVFMFSHLFYEKSNQNSSAITGMALDLTDGYGSKAGICWTYNGSLSAQINVSVTPGDNGKIVITPNSPSAYFEYGERFEAVVLYT